MKRRRGVRLMATRDKLMTQTRLAKEIDLVKRNDIDEAFKKI